MYAFNYKLGQTIQTDAAGVAMDMAFLGHFQISAADAVAASATAVHAAIALTDATQAITTNITNPGAVRNISVTGNASGITGNVVIKGTNYSGDSISETIALNGTSTVEGAKAFKTVTEIDLPIQTHAGTDTVSVGFGEKLGLPVKLAYDTIRGAYLNNVKEGTAPTVTVSSTSLESNTFDLNSSLNGSIVDIYLIV